MIGDVTVNLDSLDFTPAGIEAWLRRQVPERAARVLLDQALFEDWAAEPFSDEQQMEAADLLKRIIHRLHEANGEMTIGSEAALAGLRRLLVYLPPAQRAMFLAACRLTDAVSLEILDQVFMPPPSVMQDEEQAVLARTLLNWATDADRREFSQRIFAEERLSLMVSALEPKGLIHEPTFEWQAELGDVT